MSRKSLVQNVFVMTVLGDERLPKLHSRLGVRSLLWGVEPELPWRCSIHSTSASVLDYLMDFYLTINRKNGSTLFHDRNSTLKSGRRACNLNGITDCTKRWSQILLLILKEFEHTNSLMISGGIEVNQFAYIRLIIEAHLETISKHLQMFSFV